MYRAKTNSAKSRQQVGSTYTAPLIIASGDEPWIPAPTGFVLSKTVLLTVRFTKSTVFDAVSKELSAERFEPTLAYVRILEELVDHMADLLEATSRDLDDASHLIFRHDRSRRLSRVVGLGFFCCSA